MLQTIAVLIVLGVVSVFVVRHFLRIFRAHEPQCSCCSGCSLNQANGMAGSSKRALDDGTPPPLECPYASDGENAEQENES